MEVKTLFIVTKPRPASVFLDICFPATVADLENQFKGGLTAAQIHGIYTDPGEASKVAEKLLFARDYEHARREGDRRFGSECQHLHTIAGTCADCGRKVI